VSRQLFGYHTLRARLLLIRHAQTDYNREGRFYGRTDVPLNDHGHGQARAIGRHLADRPLDVVWSSPALRALQTAGAVAEQNGNRPKIHTDPRLHELDYAAWEGLRFQEAHDRDPDLWHRWRAGEIPAPHGGESLADGMARSAAWLAEIVASHPGQTLAVVAHGGILQALMCVLLHTPPQPLWQYRLGNAAVAEVHLFPAGGVLVQFGYSAA
jgi:probable phosphoglycerate mutase